MYGVCPCCRTDHPIELSAERDTQGEYIETECIVCGSTFVIRKQRVTCPHCNSEVFLVPKVVEIEKSRLILRLCKFADTVDYCKKLELFDCVTIIHFA